MFNNITSTLLSGDSSEKLIWTLLSALRFLSPSQQLCYRSALYLGTSRWPSILQHPVDIFDTDVSVSCRSTA